MRINRTLHLILMACLLVLVLIVYYGNLLAENWKVININIVESEIHLNAHGDLPMQKMSTMCNDTITILVQFVNAKDNVKLQNNFYNFIYSLLIRTVCFIDLYITADKDSKEIAEKLFQKFQQENKGILLPQRIYLDVFKALQKVVKITQSLQELFSSSSLTYYSRPMFFLPATLHRVLPKNVSKIIMFDLDLQLREDVKKLNTLFNQMKKSQIMGLAREQQPVYLHVLWEYKEQHNESIIADPPPHGLTGFNSGTKLINLEAMRNSIIYNSYLDNPARLVNLANKYHFRGHLGDQDFYTLLSFDYMELFYILPCQWNRQLCEWWRSRGFAKVFDLYFNCSPPYHVLHGNCDTPIG